jgi:hypothetical protein
MSTRFGCFQRAKNGHESADLTEELALLAVEVAGVEIRQSPLVVGMQKDTACVAAGCFLAEHFQAPFHLRPTYSSGLNQVELWCAEIQRDVIRPNKIAGTAC